MAVDVVVFIMCYTFSSVLYWCCSLMTLSFIILHHCYCISYWHFICTNLYMPHPAALATNSLQNHLQALHPHTQRSHRKVSALSGRHCATYLLLSDALWPAFPLWDRQLHHTSAAHQVRIAGFFLLWPCVVELSPCWTMHHLWHERFKEQVKNLSFYVSIQHSVDYQFVLCISDFCVGFITFYCSAPMFLR